MAIIGHTTLSPINPLPQEIQSIHTIQGICLVANYEIGTLKIMTTDSIGVKQLEDKVKMELCLKLAQKMFETDCIEFTKLHDATADAVRYRARIFVTPKEQVQILRTNGVIK